MGAIPVYVLHRRIVVLDERSAGAVLSGLLHPASRSCSGILAHALQSRAASIQR